MQPLHLIYSTVTFNLFTSIAGNLSNLSQKLRSFSDIRKIHAKGINVIQQSAKGGAIEQQDLVADERGNEHTQNADVLAAAGSVYRRVFAASHAVANVSAGK